MQQKWFKSTLAAVAVAATSVIGQPAFGDDLGYETGSVVFHDHLSMEQQFVAPGIELKNLCDASVFLSTRFGGITSTMTVSGFREAGDNVAGIYLYQNDGETAELQFQYPATYGYIYGMILKLEQGVDGVYATITRCIYTGNSDKSILGTDFSNRQQCNCYTDEEAQKIEDNGYFSICAKELELTFYVASGLQTVRFLGKDGDVIETQQVYAGEGAVAPTPPTVPGYVFHKWSLDFSKVYGNIDVRALYHKLCTVTFMGGLDGQTMISQQTVEQTCAAEAPEVPAIPNYVFLNWDKDFSDIEDDLVVTAVYARTYEVVFKNPDGTVIDTQTVRTGLAATAPDMTGAEYKGVPFFGWEGDFSCVTSDLEIVAFYGLRPNFDKSFSVTIPANYSDGSCSTYPILLRLSENNIVGFDYDDFKRAGKDIYVTDAAGNQLPIELAVWNPAGESLLYVQVSSELEGTAITVSYGTSQSFDQPAGMWAGYAGVWHFEEADGYAADSTGHGLTATPHGVTEQMIASDDAVIGRSRVNATATDTKNGMGVSADINNYITDASVFTVEGWFKATSVNGYTRVFSRKNSYSDAKGFEIEYDSGSKTTGKVTGKGSSPRLNFTTAETTAGWQKFTFVINGGIANVYTNGALSASGEIAAVEAASVGFSIGNDADFNERQWWGMFDEVKFYDGAKNAAQIAFEYALEAGTAESLVYGNVKSTDTSKPDVSSLKITSEDGETMNISVGLTTLGDGADSAVAYIAYGPDAEHLSEPVKFAEGTDSPLVGVVSNLDACATYAYSIYVENGLGQVSDAKAGSFRVAAATIPVDDPLSCAGLTQAKLNNANDFTTTSPDFLQNSVIPPEVVPGVVMALYKVDSGMENSVFYTSPYTGHEFKWNGSNTTFGYFGEIYLPAGELHIGKNIDDSAYVKIGDTVVLENTQYDAFPVETFQVESAGWYPLEIRIGDGSGGKGITNTAKFENNGIAYNINGTTDPAKTGWAPLMDTQGGLLRVLVGDDTYLALGPVSATDDGAVSAWISVDHGLPAAAKLVAVYAPEDKGAISSAWNSRIVLAELAEGETMVSTKFTLPNLAKYGAVRFALLTEATETSPAFSQFSRLYEYEQILPLVAFKVGEIAEEGISVTMPVEAFGAGAESATLRLEYSFTDDFAQSEFIEIGVCTELKNVNFNITTLAPATTYFMRAVLVNSKGERNVSEVVQFTTYNSAVAHPGETLVWNGGETGTWDDSTANWLSPKGHQVVWLDGCKARFDGKATVTLSAPHSVLGFEVGADVTLKGEAITLTAPATVIYNNDATLRFENVVAGESGLTAQIRERQDIEYSDENTVYLSYADQKVLAGDMKLADITNPFFVVECNWGGWGSPRTLGLAEKFDEEGIHNWVYDPVTDTATAELKITITGSYNISLGYLKIMFTQQPDGIYAKVLKALRFYGEYDLKEGETSVWDADPEIRTGNTVDFLYDPTAESWNSAWSNAFRVRDFSAMVYDVMPVTMATEIAGDYQVTGQLTISDGAFRVVESGKLGGGTMKAPVFLADGTVYEYASDYEQTFKGPINMTSRGGGTTTTGRFVIAPDAYVTIDCSAEYEERIFVRTDIYGYVYVKDGNYHDYYMNSQGIHVKDGGTMSLGSGYGVYGHRNWNIFVEAGGTVIYRNKQNAGLAENGTQILGGEIQFPTDYSANPQDNFFTKLVMKDGARITGKMYTWAYGDYTHEIGGTSPSFIETEKVRVGRTGDCNRLENYVVGSNAKCIETLNVADVTGDANADLVVASEVYANEYTVFTGETAKYFGIAKKGAGTVKFTGASTNYNASLILESGTVAFGHDAKFNGSVLILNGDGTIEMENGAEISFGDSSAQTWTEGATLNLTGVIGRKSIRIGTDANGITPDQLAAITVNGKKGRVAIGDNGYLIVSSGMMVIVK